MFLFGLCESLGYKHPRLMLEGMHSRDVADWIAYRLAQAELVEDARGEKPKTEAQLQSKVAALGIGRGHNRKT